MSSNWDARLAGWFEGRSWRVMTERDGTVTVAGVRVSYRRGAFEISSPGVFITPFGARGRRGYVVVETGEDGRDIPGSEVAFGESVLRRAQRVFGTVSGLPEEEG